MKNEDDEEPRLVLVNLDDIDELAVEVDDGLEPLGRVRAMIEQLRKLRSAS